MNYSKHYKTLSSLSKFKLATEQINLLLNIVYVEAKIEELNNLESHIKHEHIEKRIEQLRKQLFKLTEYEVPDKLIKSMINKSK